MEREENDREMQNVDEDGQDELPLDEEEDKEEEVNIEYLNEKMETIMQKLESLNVDKEIGEKEKNRETRIIIDKIELENFKSYAGVRSIGPLHHVRSEKFIKIFKIKKFYFLVFQCSCRSQWKR